MSDSLVDIIKMNRLNKTIKKMKIANKLPKYDFKNTITIISTVDLKNTCCLKTAIIESEWITKLKKDICDGP